ncbi:Clp1/GlmU family protein [Archaeoglobus neptunius]|uniref:Clp1/GlmU family protein n=1 Tax=Archaeoglobus neptunius TaxID=2798580 RepID=UPI001926BF5D|nr:Clp1/GlmU family protein [Archaeoglobus neptunius]
MRLKKGNTILVRGRVKIEGEAEVLGAQLREFSSHKYVPVYCRGDCEIQVDGEYRIVDGETIPESWKRLAEKEWDTLFILGGTDSGKSTLAAFLANKVGGCYVLDLDIGQSDIAHPGAMGYGFVKNCPTLSHAEMINGYFVGTISPMGREARCLRGVARLWRELESRDGRKVVDTTGWVRGVRARDYKLAKMEIIQPDIVAYFPPKPPFLDGWKAFEVEKGFVLERNRDERVRLRTDRYEKELRGARLIRAKSEYVRSNLFAGKEMPADFIEDILEAKVCWVRKGNDFLVIVTSERVDVDSGVLKAFKELYDVEDVFLLSENELDGIVAGLYWRDRYLGMGLLRGLEDGEVLIETRHTEFDRIELGEFRISRGKEYIVRVP